jgi:hypothetical protein
MRFMFPEKSLADMRLYCTRPGLAQYVAIAVGCVKRTRADAPSTCNCMVRLREYA